MTDANGWTRAEEYVRHELSRLADGQEAMNQQLGRMGEDMAALKVKSGVWGAAAGLLTALAVKVLS